MPRLLFFLLLACLHGGNIALSGCAPQDAYRYDIIRAQVAIPGQTPTADLPTSAAGPPRDLTLADVLQIAQTNNPDLIMAAARIAHAQAMLEKAAAPFYPQVTVYTEYLQGDAPSAYLFKSIDQRLLPPQTDFNQPGWFENYESGVSAGLNLYSGGRDRLNRQMAQSGLKISQLDRDDIENQIMATAIGAYYDMLAAADFTTVAQASVEMTRAQLRVMQVRFEAGGALKTDLLSLQVRTAESEEMLLQSRNRQRLAQAALAEILGFEPGVPFTVIDPQGRNLDVPTDPVAALDYALTHRPDLAGVREAVRRSKMALDAAQAGYRPRLDFLTRYYVADPSMKYSIDRDNWTAGLYLNWTIFDGFATKNDRAAALSFLLEAMAADRKTLLAVQFDVTKAFLNLDEAQERITVAASGAQTARETYELVKRQYEGGAATITRYLEAELANTRARMRESAAYFDREKARAQIARAIGYWTSGAQIGAREE